MACLSSRIRAYAASSYASSMSQRFSGAYGLGLQQRLAGQIQIEEADKFAAGLLPVVEAIQSTGATTLASISQR